MNKYTANLLLIAFFISVIVYSCANRGNPQGGAKDETPPVILKEVPLSFSSNFTGKQIRIYFDEFVTQKDINNKFIMSPPMKKKAKVNMRGKYIMVEIQDTLRPETTYSLDFGDAIVDNNEGNALGFYRYVFSTGSKIDSLELAGKVIDAQTQLPLLGMTVMLYENHTDSAALKELPSYVARTDSSGMFRVTNIRDVSYRVVVLDDVNRDYMFTPEEEKVGFVDSLVTPLMWRETRMDTIRADSSLIVKMKPKRGEVDVSKVVRDSVVQREYIIFGPSNLFIEMFEEEPTQLYLLQDERTDRELLEFIFSIPKDSQLKARLLGLDTIKGFDPEDWYLTESSALKDTVKLWIKDSVVYKIDSLQLEITYLYTDSLRQFVPRTDTLRMNFKEKEVQKTNRRREKEKEDDEPEMQFLELKMGIGSPKDLNNDIVIDADKPIDPAGLSKFVLEEKVDTNWVKVDYRIKHDSVKMRRYYLEHSWKSETEYKLSLDSMSVFSIYGLYNNKIENTFKTQSLDSYGKLFVDITGAETPVIVQLYKGDKETDIVREEWLEGSGKVTFDFLHAGEYMLRAIIDKNGNRKWDTGNYLKRILPERIVYLPVTLSIKENFDVEQEFDVSKTYVREDPAKKKKEQEKDKNRNRNR